jgi:hypothetical protein
VWAAREISRNADRPSRLRKPPSFFASFSKTRLFFSKLFQRFLWWFCGISTGYNRCKPKTSFSKYLAAKAASPAARGCRARAGIASAIAIERSAARRQGLEDDGSVMKERYHGLCSERQNRRRPSNRPAPLAPAGHRASASAQAGPPALRNGLAQIKILSAFRVFSRLCTGENFAVGRDVDASFA